MRKKVYKIDVKNISTQAVKAITDNRKIRTRDFNEKVKALEGKDTILPLALNEGPLSKADGKATNAKKHA
jgi:hypothetical protein